MPPIVWTITCPCQLTNEALVIRLGDLQPVECPGCGLDYDPLTGRALPVCEGFLALSQ